MPEGAPRVSSYDPATLRRKLDAYDTEMTDGAWKDLPPAYGRGFRAIGRAGLLVRKGNVPLPVAVVKQSTIETNRAWMKQFLTLSGAVIAPHGKTTMAPIDISDAIGFGVSHVCTTFDKWKSLLLVNDDYDVTGAVRTFLINGHRGRTR